MPSRLSSHPSPYLRSAASQPVDWHPWGREAFEAARRLDRPILLDIGAVWCHWCHVMDHESYEDPAVAALLEQEWVCIKVDRDERPDVDARYQRAVQAMTGQGGWPLTAFLTAEGEVFYGGTYFPSDGKHGQPGFRTLLEQLARVYRDRRAEVEAQAGALTEHLRESSSGRSSGPPGEGALDDAARTMARLFDSRHGGFGSVPKFPHPGAGEFLLARWFDTGEAWLGDIVHRTLVGMARGGVRDHLGGGFHRYSVDERWIVPHFEKMLYDNAELLRAYVHAASPAAPAHREAAPALYRETAEGIVTWVLEEMAAPEGGYFASQDADVGPDDDGDYFTWTVEETRAALDEAQLAVVARCYDIGERGEMRHDPRRNVLRLQETPEEAAAELGLDPVTARELFESGRAALFDARAARPAPVVDRTIYTGWNGLMASAMLDASVALVRPELEVHALATLERFFREAADSELAAGVRHAIGSDGGGILEDQTHVARAALDAFEATGDPRWMDRAARIMDHVWAAHRADGGGLRDTARGLAGEGFLTQELVPIQDTPIPSPNGMAAVVLARLAALTGVERWTERRDTLLEAIGGGAAELSVYGATLLQAIDWAIRPVTHVVLVGERNEATRGLALAARRVYRPRKAVRWLAPDAPRNGLPSALGAMLDGSWPRAYVCIGTQCAPPAGTPKELEETLATFAVGG